MKTLLVLAPYEVRLLRALRQGPPLEGFIPGAAINSAMEHFIAMRWFDPERGGKLTPDGLELINAYDDGEA